MPTTPPTGCPGNAASPSSSASAARPCAAPATSWWTKDSCNAAPPAGWASRARLKRGSTGGHGVRRGTPRDRAAPRPLLAFPNPGGGPPGSRLWREGVFDSLAGRDVVMRSLSYEHYSDPAISAALEGFDAVFFLPLANEPIPPRSEERRVGKESTTRSCTSP